MPALAGIRLAHPEANLTEQEKRDLARGLDAM